MTSIFLILSIILPLCGPFIYARAILKGKAKPHRTTRFVLLIITSLTTASLFAQHDRVAIWLAAVTTLQAVSVFILSIKYGMGGWEKIDIVCLLVALSGIVAWQTTNNPVFALYFAIGADFVGMMPTVIKTYHFPKTEISAFFALDALAGGFNLLALTTWTIQVAAFPFYIVLINALIVGLVLRPKIMRIFHDK